MKQKSSHSAIYHCSGMQNRYRHFELLRLLQHPVNPHNS
nr:MAG TPA: hypothetical protein [Caudoviricetes sp.]